MISCYIIGADDKPPIHAINEAKYFDDERDEFEGISDENLTPEQIKKREEKKKSFAILSQPKINKRAYQLYVNVAKAEDLPKLGLGSVDS